MNLLQQVMGQVVCPGCGGDALTIPVVKYHFCHIRPDCPEKKREISVYNKKYYNKNKDKVKDQHNKYKSENKDKILEKYKKHHNKISQFVNDIKSKEVCKICHNSNPVVLVFHHRDPTQKDRNVPRLSTKKKVLKEVSKCDILCDNCHRILHAERHRSKNTPKYNRWFTHWLREYKKDKECADCKKVKGTFFSEVLCFHHRDPLKKDFTISQWYYWNTKRNQKQGIPCIRTRTRQESFQHKQKSIQEVEQEISKCDILCHNCHRIRHWKLGLPIEEELE